MAEKIKIISRKRMSGESKYSYCPYCVTELEAEEKDYKEILQPLFKVLTGTYVGEGKRDLLEEHYECSRCGNKNITVDTFLNVYCKL